MSPHDVHKLVTQDDHFKWFWQELRALCEHHGIDLKEEVSKRSMQQGWIKKSFYFGIQQPKKQEPPVLQVIQGGKNE